MLDIDKQYVFNEQGEAIAVQIPLEQFQEIEQLLRDAAWKHDVSSTDSHDRLPEESDTAQSEPELIDVNGILVIKSQGGKIPASIVDDMREERIREVGGW